MNSNVRRRIFLAVTATSIFALAMTGCSGGGDQAGQFRAGFRVGTAVQG